MSEQRPQYGTMTPARIKALVADIELVDHPEWWYVVREKNGVHYLQVRMIAEDHDGSGVKKEWGGRKWILSLHMTDSEVVQTALRAYLDAVEHEARESFRFRGRALYGPHIDVYAHHAIAQDIDERAPKGD